MRDGRTLGPRRLSAVHETLHSIRRPPVHIATPAADGGEVRTRIKWVVVVAAALAVVGACAVGAYAVLSANPRVTNAHVTGVALTPDRKTIVVQIAGYYSRSCNSIDPSVHRSGKKWKVRVRVERIRDFCTLEMCIDPKDAPSPSHPSGSLTTHESLLAHAKGCQQATIELDEPVPADVTVSG